MTGDNGQKSIHPRFIYFLTYPARSSKEFGIGLEFLKFLEGSIDGINDHRANNSGRSDRLRYRFSSGL